MHCKYVFLYTRCISYIYIYTLIITSLSRCWSYHVLPSRFHHVCLGNHKPGPGREGSRALLRTEKGIERTEKTMTTMVPFSKIAGERMIKSMFIYAIYGCLSMVQLWPKKSSYEMGLFHDI